MYSNPDKGQTFNQGHQAKLTYALPRFVDHRLTLLALRTIKSILASIVENESLKIFNFDFRVLHELHLELFDFALYFGDRI